VRVSVCRHGYSLKAQLALGGGVHIKVSHFFACCCRNGAD
jgi:hypothetical protein